MQDQRSGLHPYPGLHEVELGSSSNVSHFDEPNFFFDPVGSQQGYVATSQLHESVNQENMSFKIRDTGGPSSTKHHDDYSKDTKAIEGPLQRSRRGGLKIESSSSEESDSYSRENMDFDLNINRDEPGLQLLLHNNQENHSGNLAMSCHSLHSVPENLHDRDILHGSSSNILFHTSGGSRGKELFSESESRQIYEQEDLCSSHKRKSVEGAHGFCSGSRGLSSLHIGEAKLVPTSSSQNVVAITNTPSSSNFVHLNTLDEQKAAFVDMSTGPSAFDAYGPAAESAGSSHRNTRLRIAQPRQGFTFMPTPTPQGHQRSVGVVNRLPGNETATPFTPTNQLNIDYNVVDGSSNFQHHTSFPQDRYPSQWNITRSGISSFANTEYEESAAEELSTRNVARRNISDHLRFVPPSGTINAPNAGWRFTCGSRGLYGSSASESQTMNNATPHMGATAGSAENLQNQLSSGLVDSGARIYGDPSRNGTSAPLLGVNRFPFPREFAIRQPPGSLHEQQTTNSRSTVPRQRQSSGLLGVPLSSTARRDIRTRMLALAEARNMLNLLRRGERLRLEDMAILDHPVFVYGSDMFDRHREMRLDVDNMSYEELLELEERIGNVNTGLSEEKIMKSMKQRIYICMPTEPLEEIEPCCICREDYLDGDDLGRLDCGHDFHTGCIKQWLLLKNLCPICKTTALST